MDLVDSDNDSERTRSSVGSTGTFESFRKKHFKPWVLYKFTSNWEYILLTFACTFTINNFYILNSIRATNDTPNIIHHLVCFLIVGLPLNYMQLLIGQYSQLGVILFKHMSPIGHGVGYALLMNSFLWCCYFGTIMADYFMYLIASVDTVLDWMTCPSNSTNRCWDKFSNCTNSCLSETIYISSFIYWKEKYMHNIDLEPTQLKFGQPMVTRFVPMFIVWALVYNIVSIGVEKYMQVIRITGYMIFILLTTLMLVCFVTAGSGRGVALIFRINPSSLVNFAAWSRAIHTAISALALCRACHMTFGTYMTPSMPSDILSIFSVVLNFAMTFVGGIITHALIGITMEAASLTDDQVNYVWRPGMFSLFTILTEGIGFMSVPVLWSMIYFLTFILILINNTVTQIDVLERSIADAHSSIRSYRNYMLATICILCAIVGFLLSPKESYLIGEHVYQRLLPKVHCFVVMIMCFLVFWIYRVQRICDDIHFLQGFQPTKFWKMFWYIMPCTAAIPYLYFMFFQDYIVPDIFFSIHCSTYVILVSPIPILMAHEIFNYLKIHNLVGLLQPEERWGPPDPQERYLRLLFNPRQEIRSRRRDDTCQHKCLLFSKVLKKMVGEEQEIRETVKIHDAKVEMGESTTEIGNDYGVDSSGESI